MLFVLAVIAIVEASLLKDVISNGMIECLGDTSSTGWNDIWVRNMGVAPPKPVIGDVNWPDYETGMEDLLTDVKVGFWSDDFFPMFKLVDTTWSGADIEILEDCIAPKIVAEYDEITAVTFEYLNKKDRGGLSFEPFVVQELENGNVDMFTGTTYLDSRLSLWDYGQTYGVSYRACLRSKKDPGTTLDTLVKINVETVDVMFDLGSTVTILSEILDQTNWTEAGDTSELWTGMKMTAPDYHFYCASSLISAYQCDLMDTANPGDCPSTAMVSNTIIGSPETEFGYTFKKDPVPDPDEPSIASAIKVMMMLVIAALFF